MIEKLSLNAEKREPKTEKPASMRRRGIIPAIIYSKKGDSLAIKLSSKEFFTTFKGKLSGNVLIDVILKDSSEKPRTVLIKEMQRNPVKDEFYHIDFIEVREGEKISVHIPIHLKGKPVGVAVNAGILEHALRDVYVECFPKDIAAFFEVDISHLDIGNSVHVRDLKLDPAVFKVLVSGDTTIASVTIPKKLEEVVAEVPAEGVAVDASKEPELIKKEKSEEQKLDEAEGKKPAGDKKPAAEAKKPAGDAKKAGGDAKKK